MASVEDLFRFFADVFFMGDVHALNENVVGLSPKHNVFGLNELVPSYRLGVTAMSPQK